MRRTHFWICAACAALLATGFTAWRAGANNVMAPQPTAVAVVNVEKVINNLDEREALQQALADYIDGRRSRLEERQKEVQDARARLEVLPPGNDRKDQQETVSRLQMLLEAEGQFADRQVDFRRGEIFGTLFEKIRGVVDEIAKEQGYGVVLSNDSVVAIQFAGEAAVTRQIASLKVLYASESIDISDEVIRRMNSK
ncbi:MAG: OmpH family outer membrane protein [Planctomycetota bacterium]|nr:OmpH family outer membrane protein [Planctomycetota bacterium]